MNELTNNEINIIQVKIDGVIYPIKVFLKEDYSVKTKDITIYKGEKINNPELFISSLGNIKDYKISYINNIDYQKEGRQKIQLLFQTQEKTEILNSNLTIITDNNAPKFSGIKNIIIERGEEPDYYKNVIASDDKDGIINFDVDTSNVNTEKIGEYYAIYKVIDSDNNKVEVKRKIIVDPTIDDLYKKSDSILMKVINNEMSEKEKAIAIGNYVRNNIKYTSDTIRRKNAAAWQGINDKKGDCYITWALTTILLEKAGIHTIQIYTTDKSHYWNMVYVNNKWWHLDSTPTHSSKLMTDYHQYTVVSPRNWNRSKFPKAGSSKKEYK